MTSIKVLDRGGYTLGRYIVDNGNITWQTIYPRSMGPNGPAARDLVLSLASSGSEFAEYQLGDGTLLIAKVVPPAAPKPKRTPKPAVLSRPQRWAKAIAAAQDAIETLKELQGEYRDWLDNLPEGLQSSPTADLLQGIADLDLDSAESAISEAEGVDLPRGFGRD